VPPDGQLGAAGAQTRPRGVSHIPKTRSDRESGPTPQDDPAGSKIRPGDRARDPLYRHRFRRIRPSVEPRSRNRPRHLRRLAAARTMRRPKRLSGTPETVRRGSFQMISTVSLLSTIGGCEARQAPHITGHLRALSFQPRRTDRAETAGLPSARCLPHGRQS